MATEGTSNARFEPVYKQGSFGDFYLQELINCGGMAEIWLATDSEHKPYAMRLLRNKSPFALTERKRFLNGCEILSKIHNHEFVVGYYDHGKCEGTLFLRMEYVEGNNLKLLAFNGDPVIEQHVGNILIDMAVGLEHVHDSGFIHLDFKPENVLVSRNGNVRLIDFDLSQPYPKEPKKMAKNPGTPAYMAPEQLLRLPIDQRADIFAFGVTAYELLTGAKPFPGDSANEVANQQKDRSGFCSPKTHNPDIPAGLEKVILKCLEQDPAKRYTIASLLVRDLENILYVE